ncbi:hypothetical protein L6164_010587 [Bauhinia variegata]|uniref:Uncharacterized protein n=1 Tax=Bauhinia variegata TaxID=167791 RepID=A0ACB9PNF8_BAUVA|nr:hypothetical protein L6164_010587 [Bauhinia variegata]
MKISSATLSLSSSIPRPHVDLPLSSSTSAFFVNNSSSTFLKKAMICISNTPSSARIQTKTKQSNRGLTCNALFGLGVPELVVIAGVAALVFGPKKLPEVGKSIGKTVKSFQQAAKEFESELKKEPDSTEAPPTDKPVALSEQQEKQDIKVPSSTDGV